MRTLTFDPVKLVIGIVIVLALVGTIEKSIELCLWLILASQCSIEFEWS